MPRFAFDADYGPPTSHPLDPRNDDLDDDLDDDLQPTEAELEAAARDHWENCHERD